MGFGDSEPSDFWMRFNLVSLEVSQWIDWRLPRTAALSQHPSEEMLSLVRGEFMVFGVMEGHNNRERHLVLLRGKVSFSSPRQVSHCGKEVSTSETQKLLKNQA